MAEKSGRGRARINRPTRRLSREHFAFARGLLEGVDARVLWERFLYVDGSAPQDQDQDGITTASQFRKTQAWIADELAQLAQAQGRSALLKSLAESPLAPGAVPRYVVEDAGPKPPTLDEFAEQFLDFYSQAEILAMWKEQYPEATKELTGKRDRHELLVRGLSELEAALGPLEPKPSDPPGLHFVASLADVFWDADLHSLARLRAFMIEHGHAWFTKVPRLGAARAARVVRWFVDQTESLGPLPREVQFSSRALAAGTRPVVRLPAPALDGHEAMERPALGSAPPSLAGSPDPRRFIVPLEAIALPSSLAGGDGRNRAPRSACSLAADDDLSAIHAWLRARAKTPNTRSAYRKEAERFLLWAVLERQTALSSLSLEDCSDYVSWLEDLGRTDEGSFNETWRVPQAVWIGPKNVVRMAEGWKPFNGPLNVTSRKLAVQIVRQLFTFLHKTGYLTVNPWDQVSTKLPLLPDEGVPKVFAERSLGDDLWREVLSELDGMSAGETQVRMRVILMLAKGLGLRASEIVAAQAGWIGSTMIDGEERTILRVVGKGDKVRRLPLAKDHIEAINAYLLYRGEPALGACAPNTRLVSALAGGRKAEGQEAGRPALSRSGLFRILVAFFEECAARIEVRQPLAAAKLRAASPHWLRHTFATKALRTMSINVVQAAMGHASINTTSLYVRPEDAELVRQMDKIGAL